MENLKNKFMVFALTDNPRKDLYVKVLEYGYTHPDGFTLYDLKDNLNLSEREFKLINWEVIQRSIFREIGTTPQEGGSSTLYMLSFEDRFKLLEYTELQEARRSSRLATWIAIVAILLSISVAAWQIIFPTKVVLIEDRTNQKVEETCR